MPSELDSRGILPQDERWLADAEAAAEFVLDGTVPALLKAAALATPERTYATVEGRPTTLAELRDDVERLAAVLRDRGLSECSRVAVGLPNSLEHVAVIFALFEVGALWVPLNLKLRGEPLGHVLSDCAATHFLALEGDPLVATTAGQCADLGEPFALDAGTSYHGVRLWQVERNGYVEPAPEVCTIIYTSGTTGAAKGVQVTHSMLRASALGACEAVDPQPGDVLYLWEPLCHVGGAQMLLLPLMSEVSLALTRAFSASRFWEEITESAATHIHYLGGILQMLLSQPEHPLEKQHRVRVAWGAGATREVWEACRSRYGFALHECYGMTEASSFISVNRDSPDFGMGVPLPWFDVRLGEGTDQGEAREIEVRGRFDGLVTPGYLGNTAATQAAQRPGGFWGTGDLGTVGDGGVLHFGGRVTDSFRVRGENVSAWQVENVVNQHPAVETCAVIGVPSALGEQDLLLYATQAAGTVLNAPELVGWLRERLPRFQVPRYIQVVPQMPMTPSQRVAKKRLLKDVTNAYDAQAVSQ